MVISQMWKSQQQKLGLKLQFSPPDLSLSHIHKMFTNTDCLGVGKAWSFVFCESFIWKRWNVAIFWSGCSLKQELLGTEALRHLALIDCKYPLWCKFSCSAKSSPGSVSSQNFPAKIHPRANILSHDTRALSRISTWLISPNYDCQADVYSGNTRLSGKYAIPTAGKAGWESSNKM